MNRYKLILPKEKKPPWWREGDPTTYDLVDGKHVYDFDIVEDALPEDLVDRMHQCLECLMVERVGDGDAGCDADIRNRRPIGVDKQGAIGKGCIIRRVKGMDE